jgi:tricorn protease
MPTPSLSIRSVALLASIVGAIAGAAQAAQVDLPRFPSLSPDGATVVFSWRGDLWRAPSAGGEAIRLTSNSSSEARSAFTPDGTRIVFESDREGLKNLWSMKPDGSDLRQLTELDAGFLLSSVGLLDGRVVAFIDSTIEGDLYRSPRPFVVPLEGGTPLRLHDAFGGAPAASADGSKVLFERGGSGWSRRGYTGPDNRNVWLFDPAAKTFVQLTKYDGNDGMPRFVSADEFVYVSDRGTGALNLHRAKLGAGVDSGKRLTDFSADDIHGLAVSADGKTAVFGVLGDLWRLDLTKEGAKAEKLAFTAADDGQLDREFKQVGRSVSDAALSPDGKTMAFVADGDVFVRATEDKSPTRRVTEGEARERDLCWSADGLTLYFASDRDGSDSIYGATVTETRSEARTRGKGEKKAEEAPKPEQPKTGVPTTEVPGTDAPKPEEPKPAAPTTPEPTPAASPAAGAPTQDPKPETPKSEDPSTKEQKGAEGKKDEKKKDPRLNPERWADALTFDVKAVTSGPDNDRRPAASPDGTALLFTRNLGDLARIDLATGEVTMLREGWDDDLEYVYSPDGTMIALAEHDLDFNKDIWLLAADGSRAPVNITRHPDNDGRPRFSADGKMLAFLSERTYEESDVWVVMLDRDLEGSTPRDLDQYFKDAADAAKKRKPLEPKDPSATAPAEAKQADATKDGATKDVATKDIATKDVATKEPAVKDGATKDGATKDGAAKPADKKKPAFDGLELDDAYLRVRRVTTVPGDEGNVEISPVGDRIYFTGTDGKESALFSVKYDGSEQKKLGAAISVAGITLTGERLFGVNAGQGVTMGVAAGDMKSVDISATSEIVVARRNIQKLDEVSRIMGGKFYLSPAEKKLDWPALTSRHRDLAARARTADEFDFVANMFIGHLDASHLGVRSPEAGGGGAARGASMAANPRSQGRLGVTTERSAAGRVIVSILPDSPAALCTPRLEVGDVITQVDFESVDPAKPLEAALAGKTGQEVFVSFTRPAKEGADAKSAELGVIVVPMSSGTERTLRYQAETLANRAKVAELSGGRIGYIHIQGMDQASLDRYERDLYAAAHGKDALIIDVRNNGGGSTADRLLASIDVREHAYTVPREGDRARKTSYPQDRLFIQRYTMPKAMLCNEKSFSNAEIISHAFKTLGLGPLVGQQTAGGVISTGSESLVDGTTVRMPFRGWYLAGTGANKDRDTKDRDLEEFGAMPDFVVPQTPEDESRGNDAQLAKAVEELMKKLPRK